MATLTSPIRQGDPLFVSLFENIEQTHMDYAYVDGGVRVEHVATTDCGVLLIQDHADSVTNFVNTGIRRPDFSWTEPDVCDSPQLIDIDPTTIVPPPATTSTTLATSPTASTTSLPIKVTSVDGTTTSTQSSTPTMGNNPTDSSSSYVTNDVGDAASLVEREIDPSSTSGHNVGPLFGILLGLWSLWCF